jgi:hypothetical protein
VIKISVVPEQRRQLSLDYNLETKFENMVQTTLTTFPGVSFQEDQSWISAKTTTRRNSASAPSNFRSRTEDIASVVTNLLNQVLRELQYGAELGSLKKCVEVLAKDLKDWSSSGKKPASFV